MKTKPEQFYPLEFEDKAFKLNILTNISKQTRKKSHLYEKQVM